MPPRQRLPRGLRRAVVSVFIALPATGLASCSLGGAHSSPAASQSQAPGAPRFTADSFSVALPAGWTDKSKDAAAVSSVNAGGTVLMLLYAPATAAGVNNEHIDVSTVAQPVPDDQLETYLVSAGQNGATNLSRAEPFDLNGSTGIFITYELKSSNAVVLEAQDMLVNHAGSTYDIVLNTAQADFASQLPALREVLSTWRWRS